MGLIGVTISELDPISVVHVPLRPGLNVIYGRNGSGKSRILEALRSAAGVALAADRGPGFGNDTAVYLHFDVEGSVDVDELMSELAEGRLPEEARQEASLGARVERAWARQEPWKATDIGHASFPDEMYRALDLGRRLTVEHRPGQRRSRVWASVRPEESPEFQAALGRQQKLITATGFEQWTQVDASLSTLVSDGEWPDDKTPEELLSWWERDGHRAAVPTAFLARERLPWVPVPLLDLGTIDGHWLTGFTEEPSGDLAGEATKAILGSWFPSDTDSSGVLVAALRENDLMYSSHSEEPPSWSLTLGSEFLSRTEAITETANEFLTRLLDDPPILELMVAAPGAWVAGWPVRWLATDPASRYWVKISDLSTSQRRWSTIAAQWAMGRTRADRAPSLILIDEPEGAIHPAALEKLGSGLHHLGLETGAYVVAATHSPAVMNTDGAALLHVSRRHNGETEVSEFAWVAGGEATAAAQAYGMTVANLLLLTRLFVIVEGDHDVAILRRLFGPTFDQERIAVLPMRGTYRALSVLDSQWIFDATSVPVLVVVDNARPELRMLWTQARERTRESGARNARTWLEERSNKLGKLTSEEASLRDLMFKALDTENAGRLVIYGLSKDDIIYYTDPAAFVPGATSWEDLDAERSGERNPPGNIKKWLTLRYGVVADADSVADALPPDHLHEDLRELYDLAIQTAGRSGWT